MRGPWSPAAIACLLAMCATPQSLSTGEQEQLYRILPLFQKGEYQQAEHELDTALEQYPRSAVLRNALGVLYRKLNRTEDAAAAFTAALRELPSFTAAQLQLAEIFQEQGRKTDAAALFVKAGEGTGDRNALMAAALGAAECGDSSRAIPLFEKARAQGAESPSLLYNLALAQYNTGQDAAALSTLRAVPGADEQPDAVFLRGKVRQNLNDAMARDDLAKACRLTPAHADYCSSAATELARQERFNAASESIQMGLRAAPRSETLLVLNGLVLFRLGRYAESAASYTTALEMNPRSYPAREGLAFLYYITGDLEKARQAVEPALRDSGADFYLFQLHAMILARLSPELRDRALASVNESIRGNPSFAPAYFLRGKLRMQASDVRGAEADFLESAKLDPKFPLPHYQLAKIYHRQGRTGQAESEERQLATLGNLREEEALARQTQDRLLSAAH